MIWQTRSSLTPKVLSENQWQLHWLSVETESTHFQQAMQLYCRVRKKKKKKKKKHPQYRNCTIYLSSVKYISSYRSKLPSIVVLSAVQRCASTGTQNLWQVQTKQGAEDWRSASKNGHNHISSGTAAWVGSWRPSLWTKRCAAFGHTVWGCYYINFGGKLIYTARLWARILRASEAIWAAILAQIPQNFSHMYLHMSSNRYVSRFYEQSPRWPKLMTIIPLLSPLKHRENLLGYFRRRNPSL